MINVGRVINSPKFSQPVKVWRKSGTWIDGRWSGTETSLTIQAVVTVANAKDITQVPEGDRAGGMMVFHSSTEMFVTHNDVKGRGTSDEFEWRGARYRLFNVFPLVDYGYYKAIGAVMGGM